MESLLVVIDGEPAAAMRPRVRVVERPGWHARAQVYDPAPNVAWKDSAIVAYDRQHPDLDRPVFPQGMPLAVRARFAFTRPKYHYGTGRNAGVLKPSAADWHVGRPDVDNLLKLALDALAGRVFYNDQQIARAVVSKAYIRVGESPYSMMEFWPLEAVANRPTLELVA